MMGYCIAPAQHPHTVGAASREVQLRLRRGVSAEPCRYALSLTVSSNPILSSETRGFCPTARIELLHRLQTHRPQTHRPDCY